MTYLIEWATHNHPLSIKKFLEKDHHRHSSIKVLGSWHVVGENKGFLLVETEFPAALHHAIIEWSNCLHMKVMQVMDDSIALGALEDFSE